MPPQVVVQVFGGGVGRVERNRQRQFILNNIPMLAPSAKYTKKHGIFMLQKRAWMHRGFSRGDFLIFYCFMVLCFDFELWTHFSWEFQGGHICTNSFKHVFIALRAESRVLGREELTMWPRHKKIETSSQPPPRCCSWILHIAYLPSQLPSWLHFLNKASTNTKEYYVSYLNIFLPRKAGNWKIKGKILGYLLYSI